MSIETVRNDLSLRAAHLQILETEQATPTVQDAAEVHGVAPGQIAKTLAYSVLRDGLPTPVLIVASGMVRVDNSKLKAALGGKAKMLKPEEVLTITSHPVGGVCPFGLPRPLTIYLDASLRQYQEVYPAAGSINSAVRISISELERLTQGVWVDVSRQEDGAPRA